MKTSKPFSTISYNTVEFLKLKLNELVKKRFIAFFSFIHHYPEVDEKKDHRHLLIIPNGQIDTNQIDDILQELDPLHLDKPLACMPFRSSKWEDWYLYSSHDSAYLASKGQTRKYHYIEKDFVASDEDYLHELISTIDRTKYAKTQDFVAKVKSGTLFSEMLQNGQIPAPQFNQWRNMYEYIKTDETFRDGRITHSPVVDALTGEIVKNKDKTN